MSAHVMCSLYFRLEKRTKQKAAIEGGFWQHFLEIITQNEVKSGEAQVGLT